MHRRVAMLLAPLGLLFLAAAADPPPKPAPTSAPPPEIVAQRGNIQLTAADVRAMLVRVDPAARPAAAGATALSLNRSAMTTDPPATSGAPIATTPPTLWCIGRQL